MRQNLLLNAVKQNLITSRDSGLAQRCYNNCCERFSIFHILNYIMYTEALNAFDIIEESGMMKHDVKRYRKYCEREWTNYQTVLKRSLKESAWYLIQDYCMAAHEGVSDNIETMVLCFHNYLLKLKCNNSRAVARLSASLKIADIILILWPKYFQTYKDICGLDFSMNFSYADMHVFTYYLKQIGEIMSRGNDCVDYSQDVSCVNAMAVVEYKLADDGFLDGAAMKALEYSDAYHKMYMNLVETTMEKEEYEQMRMLSTKFDKVSKLKNKKK